MHFELNSKSNTHLSKDARKLMIFIDTFQRTSRSGIGVGESAGTRMVVYMLRRKHVQWSDVPVGYGSL